jgi:hypothetical protein
MLCCLTTGPKPQDWKPLNCEPKYTFSFYRSIISCIFCSDRKLTNRNVIIFTRNIGGRSTQMCSGLSNGEKREGHGLFFNLSINMPNCLLNFSSLIPNFVCPVSLDYNIQAILYRKASIKTLIVYTQRRPRI